MLRIVACGLFCLFQLEGLQPVEARADGTTPEDPSSALVEQLRLAREGIVDTGARPEDRRRWIDILFSYSTPQAHALIVELLQLAENPDAQRAVCEGIARHARTHPERLVGTFVGPLIELLGSDSQELRAGASKALADFPAAEVVTELGAIARRADVAMDMRLAAIDAMANKVDSRAVIRELMALLEADVPDITGRVVAALQPVSREELGADLKRWRAWWARKSQLDEEAWLVDRLRLYRDRVGRLERDLEDVRRRAEERHVALSTRAGELQRDIFRSLGSEQQRVKLAEWLTDPLPEIALVSLDLIRARMADVGQRPEGEVLLALLALLSEGTTSVRLVVLEIIQNLKNEPSVGQAILAEVETPTQPELRSALFKALGRLDNREAIPALIIEIANPDSPIECVREAAIALGHIAAKADGIEQLQDAVVALKSRYGSVPGEDDALRASLLTAMSGVGDKAFAPELLDAIESDSPGIVRPAIHGLRAIADKSKLPRLRTLTAHADPLVRVAAIEAVGELGEQDADIESVLTRLNPAIETNELAREAAWSAFRRLLDEKPLDVQLASSQRLREMPDLEIRYLQTLLAKAASLNGNDTDMEAAYDRLATVLVSQGKYADALSHLRHFYEASSSDTEYSAKDVGLRWLEAALRAPGQIDVADVVTRIAEGADSGSRTQIVETVARYFDSAGAAADIEHTRIVLAQLESIENGAMGVDWTDMLQQVAQRIASPAENAAPSP